MADVALLELTRSIVLHHQRQSDGGVQVLPTVHDAVDPDHEALDAIVSRYGGRYIRCDDAAPEWTPPRGPLNTPLAVHITELCSSRNLPITISDEGGPVVVTADDYAEATGSLVAVLRVLATLVSSEIDVPLAVVSYPLEGLDEVRAPLLWEASLAPAIFAPPQLRTLVPVAAGSVDVPAHCNRQEGSVRLVLRDGEVVERAVDRLLSHGLTRIVDGIDRPLVLFLGAGASAGSGIPQGNRGRDAALAALTQRSIGSSDLIPAFRQWLADHDRWMSDEADLPPELFERNLTLERVLREEFYSLSGRSRAESSTLQRMQRDCEAALDRQPEGRKALWDLAMELPRLVIATVNFDQLIEDGMMADHKVIVGPEQFREHRGLVLQRLRGETSTIPVLKLHGSIDQVESLVADINTTNRGLPGEIAATLDAMLSETSYLTWVWVGCSMRDADLGAWLAGKNGGPSADLQEWWVDPLPPRTVTAYARLRRVKEWAQMDQTLKDRQITETSDRFLVELLRRVRVLKGAAGSS